MSRVEQIEKKVRRTELKLIILKILKAGFNNEPVIPATERFADELEGFMKGGD